MTLPRLALRIGALLIIAGLVTADSRADAQDGGAQDGSGASPSTELRPLGSRADLPITVAFGAEGRARYEGFDNPMWGDAPDDGYIWLRLMPSAQLQAGHARLFVQPILSHAVGVSGGAGPIDRTGIDLLQLHADAGIALGPETSLQLRAGRGLIGMGSERLIGKRAGPNSPQPFDGIQLAIAHGDARIEWIDVEAVEIGLGNFDDRSTGRQRLRSIYATVPLAADVDADLYWIGFRDLAVGQLQGNGIERRDTYGMRLFGHHGQLSWNWEMMLQRGDFDGQSIRAWSLATETAITFPDGRLSPLLRLRINVASGDKAADDGRLGSFNALFPRGRYFGELTPLGPRNIVNINAGLVLKASECVILELNLASFWRASTGDGVYNLAGQQTRGAMDFGTRNIGNQAETSVTIYSDNGLSFSGSFGIFTAGAFIRQTSHADAIVMVAAEATFQL